MPLEALVPAIRSQFPALSRHVGDRPAIFFDGPAGTQCPRRVIAAVTEYLTHTNSNHGGLFAVSRESDRVLEQAHRALADLLGTGDPGEIVFGANMTTLTFALSRALARQWNPGDEVIVTQLDHDANVTPWVLAARDAGATVRMAPMNPVDGTLDTAALLAMITPRTRLVALGLASNSTGSVNPVREIARAAHAVGAMVYADAVHFAPHASLDVAALECDFLACSAYKFFGPHVGILWGRRHLLEALPAYKVRPAPDSIPDRWMTGTQNHEGIAGAAEAVRYLADLGRLVCNDDSLPQRAALEAAYAAIGHYESRLIWRLIDGLREIPAVKVWGITDSSRRHERLPTISITHERIASTDLALRLAEQGIFVWHGHYYAVGVVEAFGLQGEGMVRVGLAHYNTAEEVDRLVQVLQEI